MDMILDRADTQPLGVGPALPCTRARQGIWTLWWRYEFLRAQLEGFEHREACDGGYNPMSNDHMVEYRIVAAELARLSEMLEANGMLMLDHHTASQRKEADEEG